MLNHSAGNGYVFGRRSVFINCWRFSLQYLSPCTTAAQYWSYLHSLHQKKRYWEYLTETTSISGKILWQTLQMIPNAKPPSFFHFRKYLKLSRKWQLAQGREAHLVQYQPHTYMLAEIRRPGQRRTVTWNPMDMSSWATQRRHVSRTGTTPY